MSSAGGPGSVRKCHGTALADLGDTGFDRDGKEGRLYDLQLSEGVYKRKEVTLGEVGTLKFDELSDVGTSHVIPKRSHTLVFTGSKWIAFADPVQTVWLIDIHLSPPHVVTGNSIKLGKW